MSKKHFICTHTCHSAESRKTLLDSTLNLTDREFFSGIGTEKAELLQHWMGKEDFFFCHWYAESEEAILEALGDFNDLIVTLPHEMPRYVSVEKITGDILVNPDTE